MVRASDFRSSGRGFDSWLGHYRVTILGRLFTLIFLLSPINIIWYCPMGGDASSAAGKLTVGLVSHRP